MAKHPPGMAVKCYRILVFVALYHMVLEGREMLGCRTVLPALCCPLLCVNPSPMPATPLPALPVPFQRQLRCSLPKPCVPAETDLLALQQAQCCSVCRCRCCSPPSIGISTVILSMSLAWQEQGAVPAGPSLRVAAMSWLLLRLIISSTKKMFKPNLLWVFFWLLVTTNPSSLLL